MGDQRNGDIYNITTHNQAGGITAGQIQIGQRPRFIDAEAERILLGMPNDKSYELTAIAGDPETYNTAVLIQDYLRKHGYTVRGIGQSTFQPPRFDLGLEDVGDHYTLTIGHRSQQ